MVGYAFQHLGEQAVYEEPAPVAPEKPDSGPPVQSNPAGADPNAVVPVPPAALPARSSRLVFAVAAGETIELSTDGVLAAMGRLPLVVHKLALPGDEPTRASLGLAPGLLLPGGLVLHLTADGPILARADRTASGPDVATVDGLALQSRALRAARGHLAREAGVPLARARLGDLGTEAETQVSVAGELIAVPPLLGPGGLVVGPPIGRPRRPRPSLSSRPGALETSIEAPFRLVISPSVEARWAHADGPRGRRRRASARRALAQPAGHGEGGARRHDLRRRARQPPPHDPGDLGPRPRTVGGRLDRPEEEPRSRRRPRSGCRSSPADRHMLVRQTAETWLDGRRNPIAPVPVGREGAVAVLARGVARPARRMDDEAVLVRPRCRRSWSGTTSRRWAATSTSGSCTPATSIRSATSAALVKVTERKMKRPRRRSPASTSASSSSSASGDATYGDRLDLPMSEVVDPSARDADDRRPRDRRLPRPSQDTFFWPAIGGQRFRFIVEGFDHAHQPLRLPMPLMWVPEPHPGEFAVVDKAYDDDADRKVVAFGQKIAFGKVHKGGDTVVETESISFRGKASLGDSRPHMSQARVVAPGRAAAVGHRLGARSPTTTSTGPAASTIPTTRARCGRRCSPIPPSASTRPTTSSPSRR